MQQVFLYNDTFIIIFYIYVLHNLENGQMDKETIDYLMRGVLSVHKENDSLIEDITVRQLREAGQGMVFDELNLDLQLQITNNNYIVSMGINDATLYVCIIDRASNSCVMIKVFANRLARRFMNNRGIVSRTSVY